MKEILKMAQRDFEIAVQHTKTMIRQATEKKQIKSREVYYPGDTTDDQEGTTA